MKESTKHNLTMALTWLCRLLVGGTFLFSGFVKAIDPWGTIYKLNDYLAALGIGLWDNLVLVGIIILCVFEFLTGAFLVTGSFRRAAPIMAALMMLFMTPLTLWIALKNPVADCGCFGDAYIISNWATFWKNIAITAATIWLLTHNKNARWLITPALQWLGFVADAVFVGAVALLGYFYQPLIDYRPYKAGQPLIETTDGIEHETEYSFVYEKDGVKKEFSIDDELPDESDGWVFVERKEKNPIPTTDDAVAGGKGLSIWNGDDNITSEAVVRSGAQFILFIPDISDVSIASSYQINSLFTKSQSQGIGFMAVVAGSSEEIERWKDLSLARYPIYTAEDTSIKEVVRGNPAIVYLEDGSIKWKSTLRALQIDDFLDPETEQDPMKYAYDNESILRNIILLYIATISVIILLSFSPKMKDMFNPWLKPKRK